MSEYTKLNHFLFFVLGIAAALGFFFGMEMVQEKFFPTEQGIAIENTNETVSRSLPIVAVNQDEDNGTMGSLTVKLIPGNSSVLIDINPFLETDLQFSANTAIEYAKRKTGFIRPNRDFVLTYQISSNVIGGGSAGAATAIAAIAAIENKTLNPKIAITGTINPDGSIGQVGGVLEKAKAVSSAGYTTFLVPKGQTKIRYYEQVTEEETGLGYTFYNKRYVPRTIDIKDQVKEDWGLNLVEVSDINQAMKYMVEQ